MTSGFEAEWRRRVVSVLPGLLGADRAFLCVSQGTIWARSIEIKPYYL